MDAPAVLPAPARRTAGRAVPTRGDRRRREEDGGGNRVASQHAHGAEIRASRTRAQEHHRPAMATAARHRGAFLVDPGGGGATIGVFRRANLVREQHPSREDDMTLNPHIRRHHHLTLNVGGAQEDYGFHTKILGLKSVKKTALYDGEQPILHLYYGNDLGDEGTLITCFPMRQSGRKARPGTGQISAIALSVPRSALPFWRARLKEHGFAVRRRRALRRAGAGARAPLRHRLRARRDRRRRSPAVLQRGRPRRARHPRDARHHRLGA